MTTDPTTEAFGKHDRDHWTQVFATSDACVTPVLTWAEASVDEHLVARSTIVTADGVEQAAPAPRFSRTPSGPVGTPPQTTTALDDLGW